MAKTTANADLFTQDNLDNRSVLHACVTRIVSSAQAGKANWLSTGRASVVLARVKAIESIDLSKSHHGSDRP